MKHLDTLFDLTCYLLILTCFTVAITLLVQTIAGQDNIGQAVIITALGIGVSLFLFWIKSWAKSEGNQ